jgi:glycosyltransferase involved in cell wall biosynthesis
MEWRIIYLGAKGGGSQLTDALLECFNGFSKGIISNVNQETMSENVSRIPQIPTGVVQNLIFPFRLKLKAKIVEQVLKETRDCKCIFVMAHPVDKLLKRKMKQNEFWTVIHDATKHKGDLWPTKKTIKNLAKQNRNLIFLSEFVRDSALQKFNRDGEVLPLISPIRESLSWEHRVYDISILGRNKIYKNLNLGLEILKNSERSLHVFLSSQNADLALNDLEGKHELEVEKGWLSIERFVEVLAKSKILLLTHQEASQSGLISLANSLGTYVIAPRVGGLSEQVMDGKSGKLVRPNSVQGYLSAIEEILNLNQRAEVIDESASWKIWSQKVGISVET